MRSNKKFLIIFSIVILILFCGCVSAQKIDDFNVTQNENNNLNESSIVSIDFSLNELKTEESDEIIVNGWNELQYYCSLEDKDYTLRLKENTNFYPTSPTDSNYQIKINNNVKIIGSDGAYIGDDSSDSRLISYASIIVPDGNRKGLTLENITFKWIHQQYQPDAIFINLAGNGNYLIKNCHFENIQNVIGNGAVITLKKGSATIENCSFISCNVPKGIIDIYGKQSLIMKDCYFANNYGYEHTTCIKNYGNLKVYNSKFYKNRSAAWAGGITTYDQGITDIYNCNFTGNVAGWNGGALYCYNIMNIYNSTFIDNNCTTNNGGGAIGACQYQGIPRIYIENSLFKDNNNLCWGLDELSTTGTGRGGAISFMDSGSIEIRNTVFIGNSASMGTAICAIAVGGYGSPDIIIVNNTFINHTRAGDVLNVSVFEGSLLNVSGNYYLNNSIEFSELSLTPISIGNEQTTFKVSVELTNPNYYEDDILDKTLYDVYINNKYVKTVNTNEFMIDFGDLDIYDVYVIPTISNRKSNMVTVASTREYVFVSEKGSDNNNGLTRDSPVRTIKKALDLASDCQNIIILDGDYNENVNINYDVALKGEGNATLTDKMSFNVNSNFTLKNFKIHDLKVDVFIKQNEGNLVISNCILTNNEALIVQNNGFTTIINSILLNNSHIIQRNTDYVLDYNWWGSLLPDLNINKYVILNISCDVDVLENNQKANVKPVFYLNDGSKYTKLPEITLDIATLNGIVNKNITSVDSGVVYTLTGFSDGVLTVGYNDFTLNKTFVFLKSNPGMSIAADDVMFGEDLTITISLPCDVEGNLTVNAGNISQSKVIESSKTVFTFPNLKSDTYTIFASFTGDKKYLSKSMAVNVNVNKYQSSTNLNISAVNVGEDVILTIATTNSSTGTVTLSINNNTKTLVLTNSRANYTIKNIKRGDYLITAVYNGDDKYLTSKNSKFIEVDNLDATMTIRAEDISYGETAVIKVTLNDDATGDVFVTIDGCTNSSEVIGGKAEVVLLNLDAGLNKNISVFYSGDDTYFNKTGNANFTINKAELSFNISSDNVKIGQDVVIHIKVPAKTTGTFIICDEVLIIPLSGGVDYTISNLEIGNYTYNVTYNGNNYNTVSKTISFEVSEYPTPQWSNQGFDTKNTGKSIYDAQCNGEISHIINFENKIIGDLTIDCEGNIYITTSNGIYSYDIQGNLRYIFISDTLEGNFSGTAIGRDVVISPKSSDKVYFINQTTGEKYGSSNLYQGSSIFSPIIDSNANIYIMSEYQVTNSKYSLVKIPYKSWEFGGEIKSVDLGKFEPLCSPTLDENIIVVVSDNRLRMIDAKTLETISIKQGNYLPVRPVIGEGSVVYTVLSDSIVAYNSNGVQVWKTKVIGGVGNILAIDTEQAVYHINAKGLLYKYDIIDGAQSKVSNLKITSGLLIGSDGTLYFGSNNMFYAMDSEGNILWKSDLNAKITGNPVMDKNGLIYVPTEKGIVALTHSDLNGLDLKIKVDDIIEGEKATITITWNNQTTGTVSYNLNGEDITVNAEDAKITKVISGLTAGYYDITVSYSGDMRFKESSITKTFVVRSTDDVANNIQFDGNQTFTFSLTNAQGNLTVNVAGKTYSNELINGQTSIIIDKLSPGDYEAIVTYSGDRQYNKANRTFSIEIPKFKIDLNEVITTENVVSRISVSLPVDATGTLTVAVGGKTFNENIVDGKASVDVSDLAPGSYNATVIYSGDSKYDSITKTIEVNVAKVVTELNNNTLVIDSQNISSGVSINLPEDATGTLSVTVDGKTYTENLVNGKATVNIPELADGEYNMTVTYSGDGKYEGMTKTTLINVTNSAGDNSTNTTVDNSTNASVKVDPVLVISADDVNAGESAVINVITSVKTGKLVVNVDNKDYELVISNGESSVNISDLAVGNYTVVARFAGDDKFNEATNSTRFSVLKVNVPVTNETISIPESDATEYSVSLPSDATGTLTVTVDGKDYSETLVNGKATVNIPELSEGSHNITVSYSGDSKYSPISKTSVVVKSPVNTTDDNNSTGENATQSVPDEAFTIPENGNDYGINLPSDATGTLTVTVDGVSYTQKLVNGKAIVSIPELSEGSHNITVTYSGDGKYASITKSSVVVKEHVPVIKLTASNLSMFYTSGKYFKVRLTSDGKALPNQKIKITINGKTYTKTTDKNGYASLKISLPPKAYTVKVTYGNLTITKKVTVKTVITAKNINAKKSSKSIKIKVTLKKVNKKYLKNKKVTLKFNKKTFKVKTNKKGVATFTVKNSVYKKLKTNKKYTYQVIYAKDKVKKSIKFKK